MHSKTSNCTNFFNCLFSVLGIFLFVSCNGKKQPSLAGPVEAKDALATYQIADGFKMELVASEPLVTDPVDMEIDENGTMYVVEMHGYPLDKSGSGRIIILKDENCDGMMDKRIVFKEGLVLPNSIMRWKKGVLVTDSPNLLYLEDTDGDGQANITDTVLTGFALTNPQHNMNNPIYGIDNWIYVAHENAVGTREYKDEFGDEGKQITYYRDSNATRLPKNANGRSIRLRPDTKQLEMLSSACQFGHTIDEWGRRFNCNNSNQGFQEVIANRYFERNPAMFVSDAIQNMSDHLDAAEVFPTTLHPDRQILTDAGVLTSACGLTKYMGNAFPEPYNHNVTFVAEPVSNLVHIDVLRDSGASFVASRVLQNKEFISSTDAWSRPVNFYVGPDGEMYMLDYYRKVIESPEWMSDEAIKAGGLYDGMDKGRIFRITAKDAKPVNWTKGLSLGKSGVDVLVKNLGNGNFWWRINAQRLLVDRQDKSAVPALVKALTEGNDLAKVHALWTLDGLNAIESKQLVDALHSTAPGVLENAIQVAEKYLNKFPAIEKELIALQNNNNPKVRFQLLLTLGFVNTPEAAAAREQLLFNDINDKWVQVAALSASTVKPAVLLNNVLNKKGEYASLIERLSSMIAATGSDAEVNQLIVRACNSNQGAVLKGLSDGLHSRKTKHAINDAARTALTDTYFKTTDASVSGSMYHILAASKNNSPSAASTARAVKLMNDSTSDYRLRAAAIKYLRLGDVSPYTETLKKFIVPSEEPVVQLAALQTLADVKGTTVSEYIIKQWPVLTPEVRSEAVNTFLRDNARIAILLNALEKNIINTSSVRFGTSVELMQNDDSLLRNKARAIFTRNEKEREKVRKEYDDALQMKGDNAKGKQVFAQNCGICHQVRGKTGVAIGPDLGTVHNWIREDLLANILDPNMAIASGYDTWQAMLNNGENVQGIIAAETPAAITFRANNMQDRTVSRVDIKTLKALNTSLMPTGLEKNISKQQMADLMAFLRSAE